MGIGKSIEVNAILNHSNSFYYAGEQLYGTISLYNTKKNISFKNMTVGFMGELGYATEETYEASDGMGYVEEEDRTVYHKLPFVDIHLSLVKMRNNEGKIILNQGQNSWPFEFTLPHALPPSSSSSNGSHHYIKYYIYVAIDQSRYHSNKKYIYPVIVFPSMNTFNISNKINSLSIFKSKQEYLQLVASLQEEYILPGQTISLNIDLVNHKHLRIKRFQAALIQHRIIADHDCSEVICRIDLPIEENFNEAKFHNIIDINVPNVPLAPTHFFTTKLSTLLISIDINYELTLEVQADKPYSNIELRIPIIIGTKSSFEQSQFVPYQCKEAPISCAAALKEVDMSPVDDSVAERLQLLEFVH